MTMSDTAQAIEDVVHVNELMDGEHHRCSP
jgi:hypothetical protein